MRRVLSCYVVRVLFKGHNYQHHHHHSTALFEAGNRQPLLYKGPKDGDIFGLQPDFLHGSDKVLHGSSQRFVLQRLYSTQSTIEDDDAPTESEMRRKFGWLLKLLAAVTITYVSFNAFPIMGDSLIWQSVALVRLDDPFMKRSGASRICWIATNDRRRKSFVEVGGVTELAKMLQSAGDDKTRLEAIKALVSLCECDVAVEALHATGAEGMLRSLLQSSSNAEIESQSALLIKKLAAWKQEPNK